MAVVSTVAPLIQSHPTFIPHRYTEGLAAVLTGALLLPGVPDRADIPPPSLAELERSYLGAGQAVHHPGHPTHVGFSRSLGHYSPSRKASSWAERLACSR